MLRKFVTTVFFALAAIFVAACGETPTNQALPTPLVTPTPVGADTPAPGSMYLGAFYPNSLGGVTTVEKLIGRTFAMDAHYYSWITLFPSFQEQSDFTNGRIAVDSWNCGITDAQIVAGDADPLIITRATQLKAFGRPVFLRFMWAPNLPAATMNRTACLDPKTDGSSGNFSATEYVAAYRHIHQIFTQENATNVVWVWGYSSEGSDATAFYPGSTYVDWVGVDVYDGAGVSFTSLISPTYPFANQFGKPILISETGAVPNDQQAYIGSMMPALQEQFPSIKGLIYYDGVSYYNSTTLGGNWGLGDDGLGALFTLGELPYTNAFGAF